MVQEVVEINGVKVYSDKTLAGVYNDVVTFTDGSTCDVSTREIVNKGRGTISFRGGEEGSNEPTTKGPLTFRSSALLVRSVPAAVKVVPYSGSQIEVTVTGPNRKVEKISVKEQRGWVVIDGSAAASSGGIKISGSFSGAFLQSFTSVRGVSVSIGDGGDDTTVMVRVPTGTTVATQGDNHEVEIGDIEGDLDAGNSGSSNVAAGRVKSAKLTNEGSGNITVASVSGSLTIVNSYAGKVTVEDGQVTDLNVNNSGSGKVKVNFAGQARTRRITNSYAGSITVNGHIVNPTINNSGSSNVAVAYVSGRLTIVNSYAGKVTVEDGQVTDLNVNNSGSGKVSVGGRAGTADLNASYAGGIEVAYVEQRPYMNRSGSGRIRVGNWPN